MLPGGRVNIQKASEIVLSDFRSGAIGRMTLERPDEWRAWEKAAKEAAVLRAAEKEVARLEREARVAKAAKRR
jgi:ribosome biogenesis GTPase A